jgi:hypothetical protein
MAEKKNTKKESARKVTKEKLKKAGKTALESLIPFSAMSGIPETLAKKRQEQLKRRQEQLKRRKALKERIEKGEPDQRMMDNQSKDEADELKSIGINSKKGINIKKGGLVLRVSNRGPNHSSQNKRRWTCTKSNKERSII